MLSTVPRRPILCLLLLALSLAALSSCYAETIKLKNGKTIVCDRAREKGDQIEYEIGDNTYAIPKSMVAGIAAGGVATGGGLSTTTVELPEPSAGDAVDQLPDLTNRVVKDAGVDTEALAAFVKRGDAYLTAAAYYSAGRFEHTRGNRDRALEYLKEAVRYYPDSTVVLESYASLLMNASRPREALPWAEQAARQSPKSADAQMVLGYALYQNDRTKEAVAAWKKALELRPSATVQAMLDKAQRELGAEEGYGEQESSHFTMRYEGTQAPAALRRAILDFLEENYQDLATRFGDSPHQSVVVVLYTDQAFFDVTQAPSWMGALNDGRLRIPLRGIDIVSGELARVLRHELTHSFINAISRGRAPIWLHEGIAQMLEGKTTAAFGRVLARGFATGHYIPLNGMEASFTSFSPAEAQIAYAEALAFVEYLDATYGFSDLVRILQRIAEGSSTEVALRATIHSGYSGLEEELTAYLKKQYGE